MAYNLIDEKWIPVARASGKVERIAPADLVERKDPALRIASPRPDFDGALLEFLIGLLQSCAAPADDRAWEHWFGQPPSASALKDKLGAFRHAFVLDGDGPRFMQDLEVHHHPERITNPVGGLLIDRVGEKELADKPGLFAKAGGFDTLGFPAVAAALMALQTYAPSGGRGNLTSLRGGGPLTTVVLGKDLWETVWLNVLPGPEFEARLPGKKGLKRAGAIFPWLEATRSSERDGGKETFPDDVDPRQHFWGLPRRNRLLIEADAVGCCSIYGDEGVRVVSEYESRPSGTSYDGDFRHPLTPYSVLKQGQPLNPRKASEDGIPYRDWPMLMTTTSERRPALVVSYFSESGRYRLVDQPRLMAFGYAMDNMKPLLWSQATTPLMVVKPELAEPFSQAVHQLVDASEQVRKTVLGQVKAAWSARPKDLSSDAAALRVNPAFWARTEGPFTAAVDAVKSAFEAQNEPGLAAAKEAWLVALHQGARDVFNSLAEPAVDLAPADLRRVVAAQKAVEVFTRPQHPLLRKALGLPVDEPPQKPKKKSRTRKEATP